MKSLHVPFHFYPDAVGGTEVYVMSLVERLQSKGCEALVAAPGIKRERYIHQGISVHRFPVGPVRDIAALYGKGDALAAAQFDEILDETMPDLVHLHCLSPAISLDLLRNIRRRGIPLILTAHIPGVICNRGTLMEHGREVCDGTIGVRRCATCVLESRGMPGPFSSILGSFPVFFGEALSAAGLRGSLVTALRMPELQALRQDTVKRTFEEVDSVIVVSDWLRQVLLRNGIPEKKILLCRHGITQREVARAPFDRLTLGTSIRVAYVGRLTEEKGVHTLISAVRKASQLQLQLDIFGIVQEDKEAYAGNLRVQAEGDNRIRFCSPVPNDQLLGVLRGYDLVAIPSIWLETGPLTVYDAFAAGVPVIGSRRGGIEELVSHERNGLLVNAGDVGAWAEALTRVCFEDGLIARLRQGITKPRTMDTVAVEMVELYEKLVSGDRNGSLDPIEQVVSAKG